jgi:uncharacterized protein
MTVNPWLVGITHLKQAHGERRHEVRRGPVGPLRVTESSVPEGAEALADVVLESVDGGIVVAGTVRAPWEGDCRRCLVLLDGELEVQVREIYRPGAGDEDTYGLQGEQLDLRPLVNDALLLALPLAPLCRPDCAGLCPTCGNDRNLEPCGCAQANGDPRWVALDVLHEPPVS